MSSRTTIKLPTLAQCETALGEPAEKWAGRCYEIAVKIVQHKLAPGVAIYGHFLGKIHPKSFFGTKAGLGFCQHGWVLLRDGRILDPTRWAFENKKPYIFVGDNSGEYDEGGDQLRAALLNPPPPYDPTDKQFRFTKKILSTDAWSHVEKLLRISHDVNVQEPGNLSARQVFWLANCPFNMLQPHTYAIYAAITKIGGLAFIPQDNRVKAERLEGKSL